MKKLLLIPFILIACNSTTTSNKDSVADSSTAGEKSAAFIEAKSTAKIIFENVEKVETKEITKGAMYKITLPLQKHMDSLRLKMSPLEEKELDAYRTQLVIEMADRKVAREKDTSKVASLPVKVLSAVPAQEEYSSYKDIRIKYKNVSGKNISAIRFKWYCVNAFGETADEGIGSGMEDKILRPGATRSSEWSVLSTDLKKVVKAWAYEVVFEDGTKWQSTEEK